MLTRWNSYQALRRLSAIPLLLAQDLEVMSGALRAGSSFLQAVQFAAEDGDGPLMDEWNTLLKEVRMGASLPQGLSHLETRLPIPAIRSLACAVTIIQETGGNLAGVLMTLSDTLRQEIAFQGRLGALTAQGKMSGAIVSAMPFILLGVLSVLAPDLMRPLFVTPLGWTLLSLVIVMVAIGGFLIKKIVTIEV